MEAVRLGHYRVVDARAREDAGAPDARGAGSAESAPPADWAGSRLSANLLKGVKQAQDADTAGGREEGEAKGASARSMLKAVAAWFGSPAEADGLSEDGNKWPTILSMGQADAPEDYPGVPSCQKRGGRTHVRLLRMPCPAMAAHACTRSGPHGRVTLAHSLHAWGSRSRMRVGAFYPAMAAHASTCTGPRARATFPHSLARLWQQLQR